MRSNKILTILIFIISLIFLGNNNVLGFSDTITSIKESGSPVTLNGYDTLALKYYSSTPVICTSFSKSSPAGSGAVCEKSAWSADVSAGVATILKKINNVEIGVSATAKYYYGELAINEFLCNNASSSNDSCVSSERNTNAILGDYYNWYTDAVEAKKNYSKAQVSLSTNNLTFKKSGSNYVSNSIKITGKYDDVEIKTNVGSVDKDGNSFTVKIPVSSINAGNTQSVNVTVSVTKDNMRAMNYTCGSYQSITPLKTETVTSKDSESANGAISRTKLVIRKVDASGNLLAGAQIKVENSDKSYSKTFTTTTSELIIEDLEYGTYTITETQAPSSYIISTGSKTATLSSSSLSKTVTLVNDKTNVEISKTSLSTGLPVIGAKLQVQDSTGKKLYEWVSTATPYKIKGLAPGKYYLVEILAPSGYILNEEKVEFTVGNTSNVVRVEMKNKLTKTEITKTSISTGRPLKGAKLQIQDKDGKVIELNGKKLEWITTDTPYVIEGLPSGTYYLVETIAPSGYILSKEKVEFKIDGKEELVKVEMKNNLTKVDILKVNSVDKKPLKGAKLQIQDKDGKVIELNGKKLEWISTERAYKIEGLPVGTYYLVELSAPKGYELNKEKVQFTIDGKSTETIKVEMINQLEVEVPSTLSSRSSLLLAVAMFDIALGIGIITYVKKNKIKE